MFTAATGIRAGNCNMDMDSRVQGPRRLRFTCCWTRPHLNAANTISTGRAINVIIIAN